MTDIVTVEINCPDERTATAIAEALVGRRLAAAANVHAPIRSLYHWRGRVERAAEVPLVLKTRAELFPAVVEAGARPASPRGALDPRPAGPDAPPTIAIGSSPRPRWTA